MASILVVCTGNVCRSPLAEGLLRAALERRLGARAPAVSSAGTAGWEGSPADPNSVAAAAELGLDISGHRGRRLRRADLEEATLVLAMAREHRDRIAEVTPEAASRTFTMKELVRLLDALPEPDPAEDQADPAEDPGAALAGRIAEADGLRRWGLEANPGDLDVADPLGMSLPVFEAVAAELAEWCDRLAAGLFGPATAPAGIEGA